MQPYASDLKRLCTESRWGRETCPERRRFGQTNTQAQLLHSSILITHNQHTHTHRHSSAQSLTFGWSLCRAEAAIEHHMSPCSPCCYRASSPCTPLTGAVGSCCPEAFVAQPRARKHGQLVSRAESTVVCGDMNTSETTNWSHREPFHLAHFAQSHTALGVGSA